MKTIAPSPHDYAFRAADVAHAADPRAAGIPSPLIGGMQANIPQQILQSLIDQSLTAAQHGDGNTLLLSLLAQTLRDMQPKNASFLPFPFDFGIYRQQQILNANPNRSYFMLQNVGNNDIMIVFEETSVSVKDFSGAGSQQQLIIKQTRALRVVSGGFYSPHIAPKNAVSIFTLNGATSGVVIEGTSQ